MLAHRHSSVETVESRTASRRGKRKDLTADSKTTPMENTLETNIAQHDETATPE